MHQNTIDEDVWVRLYERLGLCESTLGGFEDIISFELRDIEKSLTASLSMKEKREMLDQKAQAIANKKKINEELEAEASGLMAHGDYILNQVNQVREAQRWMTSKDILNYLNGFFREYFPRSKVSIQDNEREIYKISMDLEMRTEFSDFAGIQT